MIIWNKQTNFTGYKWSISFHSKKCQTPLFMFVKEEWSNGQVIHATCIMTIWFPFKIKK